jgi:methionyl-tRNA synthetase
LESTDSSNQLAVGNEQSENEDEKETQEITFVPLNAPIIYDDFSKMDMRTGTILTAEKVEKSDKLLKLSVDLGFETRTIMSGIAKHFDPEKIVGQKIVVLANLAPRKMMGIESNGMVLLAEDASGKLHFVSPTEECGNGFIVK